MAVDRRRRRLLAGGIAGVLSLAGCLGSVRSGDDGGPGATTLTLRSVEVGGSPGGPVPIRPPGRVAVLSFFATWCAPCKPEMANLRAARDRFDRDAVSIVSITAETDRDAVEHFWRRYRGTWPVVLDPDLEATRRYDVAGVPTTLVFAADGDRVLRHAGLASEEAIVEAIAEALDRGGGA